MMPALQRMMAWLRGELRDTERAQRRPLGRALVFSGRLAHAISHRLAEGELTRRAESLVYTSLLSLVPLLAVSFSVLKAFGVHDIAEPALQEFLSPIGGQGRELAGLILGFIEKIQVGVLGSLGTALLFYTVISLIQKVEEAFNWIWGVGRGRSLARRFSDYLSVLLTGPVLLFAVLGITTSALSSEYAQWLAARGPFGALIAGMGRMLPWLLVWGGFSFLYAFLPNTRVKRTPALAAGAFACLLWYVGGRLFTALLATSSSYSAIYSGFAGALLFMIWLNLTWLILLLGAQVSYCLQYPGRLERGRPTAWPEQSRREYVGLAVMVLIGSAHCLRDEPPWTQEALARRLDQPAEAMAALLRALAAADLIVASAADPPAYLPARDIGTIALKEVLVTLHNEGKTGLPAVDALIDRAETALEENLAELTIRDLVQQSISAKAE